MDPKRFQFLPLTVRIETLGGFASPLVLRGTPLPVSRKETFSTASDGQESIEVHLMLGERPKADGNLTVSRIKFAGIPSAPKGKNQISVRFDIDDKCRIKSAASLRGKSLKALETKDKQISLTDELIERVLKQAEAHLAEDQLYLGQVEAKNRAGDVIARAEAFRQHVSGGEAKTLDRTLAELGLALRDDKPEEIQRSVESIEQLMKEVSDLRSSLFGFGGAGSASSPFAHKFGGDSGYTGPFGHPVKRAQRAKESEEPSTGMSAPARPNAPAEQLPMELRLRVEFHQNAPEGFDVGSVIQQAIREHPHSEKWRASVVDMDAIAPGKISFTLKANEGSDGAALQEDFQTLEDDLARRLTEEIGDYNARQFSAGLPFLEESGRDTVFDDIESLKEGLKAAATGGSMEDAQYRALRKTVLAIPWLSPYLPPFLHRCRSIDEFWQFIKDLYPTYAQRRHFLDSCFNPFLDTLEGIQAESARSLQLGEILGEGGFGVVYKITHDKLGIDFAIKVFAPSFDDGRRLNLDRFFREARILFRLHHPNIVRVYDVGLIQRRPFIKMEFFDGATLAEVLKIQGAVPAGKAIDIVKRISQGLRHAHEDARVVHRDLKPSNVMVAKPAQLRVLDFGLGIFVEEDIVSRLTRTDRAAMGGPYTAPELYANPKLIDPQTDIYSIGALWYEMLTGRPPVGSGMAEFLEQSSDAPVKHKELVLRCLAAPEMRFESTAALLGAIDAQPPILSAKGPVAGSTRRLPT